MCHKSRAGGEVSLTHFYEKLPLCCVIRTISQRKGFWPVTNKAFGFYRAALVKKDLPGLHILCGCAQMEVTYSVWECQGGRQNEDLFQWFHGMFLFLEEWMELFRLICLKFIVQKDWYPGEARKEACKDVGQFQDKFWLNDIVWKLQQYYWTGRIRRYL